MEGAQALDPLLGRGVPQKASLSGIFAMDSEQVPEV